MSQSNYILNLLNIKDENVKLNENCLKIENINGTNYKIIEATLSYNPTFCHKCSCVFDNTQTYEKNGFKTSDILMLDVYGYGCILRLANKDFYVIVAIKNSLLELILLMIILLFLIK